MPIFIRLVRAAIALAIAQRRRQMGALRREMDFGQPHHIEAPALGGIDLRHALVERFRLAAPGQRRKLVKHAEFHRRSSEPFVSLRAAAKQSRAP